MHMIKRRTPGNGGIKSVSVFLPALAAACLMAGCEPWTLDADDTAATELAANQATEGASTASTETDDGVADDAVSSDQTPADWPPALPNNPYTPSNPEGTTNEEFYFSWKDADNLFKIGWPAHFERQYNVGSGWVTRVNGVEAWFRSIDSMTGKPSFNCDGPSTRFAGEVLCVLYNPSGEPFAWFKIPSSSRSLGRLP